METRKWKSHDLLEAMLALDIWCGEIKQHLKVIEDQQVKHSGVITTYEHAKAGPMKVVGPVVRLSATPASIDGPAPMVGQPPAGDPARIRRRRRRHRKSGEAKDSRTGQDQLIFEPTWLKRDELGSSRECHGRDYPLEKIKLLAQPPHPSCRQRGWLTPRLNLNHHALVESSR